LQYFGGKHRVAEKLVAFMQPFIDRADAYVEPFVGGANILRRVKHPNRYASDANAHLICLYQALQQGWEPPANLSADEYKALRNEPVGNPLVAFAGFGCSFAGKWFGGYAKDDGQRRYASAARNVLLKKAEDTQGAKFSAAGYADVVVPSRAVVYCDPPYAGTTGYCGVPGSFDSAKFWEWVREITRLGATVFVSEYTAPGDFIEVLSIATKTEIRTSANGREDRVERLFTYSEFA